MPGASLSHMMPVVGLFAPSISMTREGVLITSQPVSKGLRPQLLQTVVWSDEDERGGLVEGESQQLRQGGVTSL